MSKYKSDLIKNVENSADAGQFVITYTAKADSSDPLDFDAANNFNLGRMLYATPLEFDKRGNITSSILSDFGYDPERRLIRFVLKEGLFFENGKEICIADVAMAIKRMIWKRPTFPVLSSIVGISNWLSEPNPLKSMPSGMKFDKRSLLIELTEDVEHPLFRFTLELFSVVPSDCFDLASGKLLCKHPSESGPYRLANNNLIECENFELRPTWGDQKLKKRIQFVYKSLAAVGTSIELRDNAVISASGEELLDLNNFQHLKNYKIARTPSSWQMMLKLNSERDLFSIKDRRIIFSQYIRRELRKDCPESIACEESFFSKLVPGYFNFEPLDFPQLTGREGFNGREFIWIVRTPSDSIVNHLVEDFCKKFGMKSVKLVRGEIETARAIEQGHYDLFIGMTGFWSMDPYGDAQMLFTPNLHFLLKDLWGVKTLQKALRKLNQPSRIPKIDAAISLNKIIHDDYIYNVIAHFPFLFLNRKNLLEDKIPLSGTIPYPWQLFD